MNTAHCGNTSPIADIFCKRDVSQRLKEILGSPGAHSEALTTGETGNWKNEEPLYTRSFWKKNTADHHL